MKPRNRLRLVCAIGILVVLTALTTPKLPAQPGVGLFRDATTRPALDQANDPTVVRTRYVNYNLDVLPGARDRAAPGSTVLLNLFNDLSFTGVLDHVENKPNGLIWVGSLQGIELSTVNLVTEDNVLVGSINYPGGMYVIRYAGNGVHAVLEIDQSQYPPERDAIPSSPIPPDTYNPPPDAQPDSGGTIDVMVVYTPAFVAATGGASAANALVDLGISQTNTSYANSGITQRVNLVYKGQVSYTEPGTGATLANWQTALNDLTNGVDGLSGVAGLRNTYAADEVSLFTNWSSKNTCGIGWYMDIVSSAMASKAFNVVERTCIDGYYSFAHEMGHNMGAHHDWYVMSNSDVTPYTYTHGRINLSAKWRTVMAYNDLCAAQSPAFNCTRIQYWSNPGLNYGGASLGIAAGTNSNKTTCIANKTNPACDADNHLVLNNTAYTVANFRKRGKLYLPLIRKDVTVTPGWETLVSIDFESTWPGSWVIFDNNGTTDGQYYWGKRTCRPYAGSYSGWGVGGGAQGAGLSCGSNYPNNASSWMVYGPFSLIGATAADLKFKLWLNSETNYDTIARMASTNGTNFYGASTYGNTAGWVDKTLDLTNVYTLGNLLGQANVWVALTFESNSSTVLTEGAYVDNIVLRRCPSGATCPAGSSPAVNNSRGLEFPIAATLLKP